MQDINGQLDIIRSLQHGDQADLALLVRLSHPVVTVATLETDAQGRLIVRPIFNSVAEEAPGQRHSRTRNVHGMRGAIQRRMEDVRNALIRQ